MAIPINPQVVDLGATLCRNHVNAFQLNRAATIPVQRSLLAMTSLNPLSMETTAPKTHQHSYSVGKVRSSQVFSETAFIDRGVSWVEGGFGEGVTVVTLLSVFIDHHGCTG